ncbi:hypothetical protein M153_4050002160 [Pseudoloma neurophilia]|uniref:Uncharacterized protein n=1 Tax=Pseudoloma neurophilia TaxID=146866 RepID=A0A0R0M3J0_9MICR|nr:hypothetical protein M153_4050002160 [Pseudoloma neurophilia]
MRKKYNNFHSRIKKLLYLSVQNVKFSTSYKGLQPVNQRIIHL